MTQTIDLTFSATQMAAWQSQLELRKCSQCLEDGVRVQTINLLRIIVVAVLRTMARDLSPAVTRLSLTASLGIRQNNALDVGETAKLYASPEVHVYA
jgi:hypothetical protein